MSNTFHVDIVSLEQSIFSGNVQALFATGKMGELGIYPGHAPLLSAIKPGQIRLLLENNQEDIFFINGGILEVQPKKVTILSDTMIRAADIDERAALEAKEHAEKLLADRASDFEYARAAAELAEAVAQIQTLEKLRKKYRV